MKKLGLLIIVSILLMGFIPSGAPDECGISERVVLENTTDASVTYTFSRGTHKGFVVLLPGQTITVDVVYCR